MTLQEIIADLIVAVCLIYIGYGLYKRKKNSNPCAHCSSDCGLRDMMIEKQKSCKEAKKNKEK